MLPHTRLTAALGYLGSDVEPKQKSLDVMTLNFSFHCLYLFLLFLTETDIFFIIFSSICKNISLTGTFICPEQAAKDQTQPQTNHAGLHD